MRLNHPDMNTYAGIHNHYSLSEEERDSIAKEFLLRLFEHDKASATKEKKSSESDPSPTKENKPPKSTTKTGWVREYCVAFDITQNLDFFEEGFFYFSERIPDNATPADLSDSKVTSDVEFAYLYETEEDAEDAISRLDGMKLRASQVLYFVKEDKS